MPHAEATLPWNLDTPEFTKAWSEYVEHRKENKFKPLKGRSVQKQWDHLASYGPEIAVEAINITLRNGWIGVFPEKVNLSRCQSQNRGNPTPESRAGFASLGALQLQLKTIREQITTLRNPSGQAWPPPLTGEKKERCDELIRQAQVIQDRIDKFSS